MSKHKKQHFIPACYLKAWCDPDTPKGWTPYVWVFTKDGKSVAKKSPEKIFYETSMYTITKADGEKDLVLEHGLSQLEKEFANIRRTKLDALKPLDIYEQVKICIFVAAMHARTKVQINHMKAQWKKPLEMMESMMEWAKTATPEQRVRASGISDPKAPSFSYGDVKALYEKPVENMLLPMINSEGRALCRLDLAIIYTDDEIGFITSDCPCVWFDPKAYQRPPFFRAPALCYKTTEIRLPISPRQCIVLNQQGLKGYVKANAVMVEEINRGTRFSANKNFVVRKNVKQDSWFDPGIEPEDSWEKVQSQKDSEVADQ